MRYYIGLRVLVCFSLYQTILIGNEFGDCMKVNFLIDTARCTGCGICCKVCLSSVLSSDPVTKIPSVIFECKEFCTACGHCESFCPQGAIRIESPELEPFHRTSSSVKITPDIVESLIISRRTIRHFQDTPISLDLVMNLLNLIQYAPSGFNLHPIEWTIVEDPVMIQDLSTATIKWLRSLNKSESPGEYAPLLSVIPKIITEWESDKDPVCYHAPALIIAHADMMVHSAGYDAIIALSYLDLIAQVYGLGTCWAGLLQMALSGSPDTSSLLHLPSGHIPYHILLIGKPRYQAYQVPKRPPVKASFV